MTISSYRLPIILALIIIFIFISTSFAQFTIQYERMLQRDSFFWDYADEVVDSEGNLYLFGLTEINEDYVLIKFDTTGEIAWQRSFASPRPYNGRPCYIAVDANDNLITASSSTDITNYTMTVNKHDTDGNALWGGPLSIAMESSCEKGVIDLITDHSGSIYVASGIAYFDTLYCSVVRGISPSGTVIYKDQLNNTQIKSMVPLSGSVLAVCDEINAVYCPDPIYPENSYHNIGKNLAVIEFNPAGPSGYWFGPWGLHSCVVDQCNHPATGKTEAGYTSSGDPSGYIAMSFDVLNSCPSFDAQNSFVSRFNSSGNQINYFEEDGKLGHVDNQGNLIVYTENGFEYTTSKLDQAGTIIWESEIGEGISELYATDANDNVYILGYTTLSCLNADNGGTEWACSVYPYDQNMWNTFFHIDSDMRIYIARQAGGIGTAVAMYNSYKKLVILDGSEDNDPIADTKFWLIRMQNDIPNLTEDTLGQFTTDENGEFELNIVGCGEFEFVHDLYNGSTSDIISVGDSLKIAKCLDVEAAVKHTDVLGTAYSIHLDNAKFDDVGFITFDSLDNMAKQEIIMDHTEVRYNLTVRVQWEARRDYLEALEDHFRDMSNYLYDVFDGQLRLDTIMIYDYSNPEQWEPSDIKIHSSNQVWPYCDPFTGNGPPVSYDILQGYASINLPRWFKGNPSNPAASEADVRDYSRTDYPYTVYNSDMHRTFAHEFGHYALRFEDEYIRIPNGAPRCEPFPSGNYGFMDSHYERDISGSFSSEMSNEYKYELAECQTTRQFVRYNKSCWDYFETRFEQVYYGLDFLDEIWAPIKKPHHDNENERLIPSGQKGYSGPNSLLGPDPSYLNYNVGNLIVFPETPVDPPVDIIDMEVTVYNSSGNLPNIDVTLNRRIDGLIIGRIPQGKTALGDPPSYTIKGEIIVLGTGPDDDIDACGHAYIAVPATKLSNSVKYEKQWFSGTIDLSTVSEDSVSLQLEPLSGSYPLIIYGNLSESSLLYTMNVDKAFPELPTALICPGYEYDTTMDMTENGNSYQADIQTDLGSDGVVVIHAEDSLHQPFFFETPYNIVSREENDSTFLLYTNDGAVIQLDSTNTAVDRIMTMRSSFPVPLGGLDDASLQVSDAYSILVYPDQQFLGGNSIRIPYSDELADSTGKGFTEENISVFRWNLLNSEWIDIGGYINADYNYIIASIEGPGVYAAFATDFVLDVEDDEHGNILPYRFELSQNYPNPFNPVTTISYSLPRRSEVSIDIFNILGQKIITLVDETKPAGDYQINWDSNDSNGQKVSTGIYFYRFQAGDYVETKKMILLK